MLLEAFAERVRSVAPQVLSRRVHGASLPVRHRIGRPVRHRGGCRARAERVGVTHTRSLRAPGGRPALIGPISATSSRRGGCRRPPFSRGARWLRVRPHRDPARCVTFRRRRPSPRRIAPPDRIAQYIAHVHWRARSDRAQPARRAESRMASPDRDDVDVALSATSRPERRVRLQKRPVVRGPRAWIASRRCDSRREGRRIRHRWRLIRFSHINPRGSSCARSLAWVIDSCRPSRRAWRSFSAAGACTRCRRVRSSAFPHGWAHSSGRGCSRVPARCAWARSCSSRRAG